MESMSKPMDPYPFQKIWAKHWAIGVSKSFLTPQRKLETHTCKTAWKRAIQKAAEATGNLAGNKITGKTTATTSKGTPKDPKSWQPLQ